jgi:hypothetical protein
MPFSAAHTPGGRADRFTALALAVRAGNLGTRREGARSSNQSCHNSRSFSFSRFRA